MLRALLFVGLGGFAGSALRYLISVAISRQVNHSFPFGTFTVNLVGCLLIGLLYGFGQRHQWFAGEGWLLLATGFCGGFTTFSAFALENVSLLREQQSFSTVLYAILSVILGIVLCRLGIWLAR